MLNHLSWTEYYLTMAIIASLRSKDKSTKHGCIITDKSHRLLATGYNSFPRSMPDEIMPQERPEKYHHFIHSEPNALINLTHPIDRKEGAIVYVTGPPCYGCLSLLWNAGVDEVHYIQRRGWTKDEEDQPRKELLIKETNLTVTSHPYDFLKIEEQVHEYYSKSKIQGTQI